jgi:hypothetical protein
MIKCSHPRTRCHIDKLETVVLLFLRIPIGFAAYIYCTKCGMKGPEMQANDYDLVAHEAKLSWLRATVE